MNTEISTWSALCIAVALTVLALRRGGSKSPVVFFAGYAVFFLMGPVLNHLLGGQLTSGTVITAIPDVAWWYTLAIFGLFLSDLLPRIRSRRPSTGRWTTRSITPVVLSVLAAYGLLNAVLVGFNAPTKRAGLEAADGFHYRFLVVEAVVVGSFWFFKEVRSWKKLYYLNAASYVIYCLSFRERDFVFVGFAVVATGIVLGYLRPRAAVFGGLAGVYVATGLFTQRAGQELSLSAALNQGSNLFVDSYLATLPDGVMVPAQTTYYRLVTLQSATDMGSTAAWFKSVYSPTGQSGYGFSLVGEANTNVGLVGIVVVFMTLGLALRLAFSRESGWNPRIAGPGVLFGFLYALRGDMRAAVVVALYVALLHVLLARRIAETTELESASSSRTFTPRRSSVTSDSHDGD